MIRINAIGVACPIPVVKAKKALEELQGAGEVEILVDNAIAVQNLQKLAEQKHYKMNSRRLSSNQYQVQMIRGELEFSKEDALPETISCDLNKEKNKVVVLSSAHMGEGNEELGSILIKGFIYAIAKQDVLPQTILCYNGGARLTCEGSDALEDLKEMEAQGVEILTCGTCLDYYKLADKLSVGTVTNMYQITEKMSNADLIIKP